MKIINASTVILSVIDREAILHDIEVAARTCYKSEDKITDESAAKMVKMLINKGHEAMLEHASLTVKFICDRGVSHELVRHRIASFAQESTRYCNYSNDKFGKEITVVRPHFEFWDENDYALWEKACKMSEVYYFDLLDRGAAAQEARSVLPNSLKTEVVVTMNMREWRHFFKLRCATTAHPQMRELTIPLLREMSSHLPELFEDIAY